LEPNTAVVYAGPRAGKAVWQFTDITQFFIAFFRLEDFMWLLILIAGTFLCEIVFLTANVA